MDQVQIDIIKLKIGKRAPEARLNQLGAVVRLRQLGRHEELLPRHDTLGHLRSDRATDSLLGTV